MMHSFPENNGLPPEFDITAVENHAQSMVRKSFEALTALNQTVLHSFDPYQLHTEANIGLETSLPEYEAAEPELADSYQRHMLHDLGLSFRWLHDSDPSNLFQFQYRNGGVQQIRLVERGDGMRIPVATELADDACGNGMEEMRLLSYDVAAETKKRLEDDLEEHHINQRLIYEFDLDEAFIEAADMSLHDKKAMIRSYEAIQLMKVAQPDNADLDAIRLRLVRHMMPGAGWLDGRRSKELPAVIEEYHKQLYGLAHTYGVDRKHFSKLVRSEQLLRLQALNEQLRRRRTVRNVGTAALGTVLTAGSAFGGALWSAIEVSSTSAGMVRDTVITAGIGAAATMRMAVRRHNKAKHVTDFSDLDKRYGVHGVDTQLRHERQVAKTYALLLSL